MSRNENFLSRWSRLKRAEAETTELPAETETSLAPQNETGSAEVENSPVPDLPDIETLTKESDFTVFLQNGVPEELKRQALQTLWRSDPVFACLDGLNDYDADFSIAGDVGEIIQTAWEVGKGFAEHHDEITQILPTDTADSEKTHIETESPVSFSDDGKIDDKSEV